MRENTESYKNFQLDWEGTYTGRVDELHPGFFVAGRDSTCQLVIEDDSVSRRHASFEVNGEGLLELVDLASAGGTYVNGSRVTRCTLREGDRISFGSGAGPRCVVQSGHRRQSAEGLTLNEPPSADDATLDTLRADPSVPVIKAGPAVGPAPSGAGSTPLPRSPAPQLCERCAAPLGSASATCEFCGAAQPASSPPPTAKFVGQAVRAVSPQPGTASGGVRKINYRVLLIIGGVLVVAGVFLFMGGILLGFIYDPVTMYRHFPGDAEHRLNEIRVMQIVVCILGLFVSAAGVALASVGLWRKPKTA